MTIKIEDLYKYKEQIDIFIQGLKSFHDRTKYYIVNCYSGKDEFDTIGSFSIMKGGKQ